jgi:hypothetical protein
MDPVVVQFREQEFKTKIKKEAVKEPKWNESFNIDVKYTGVDMTEKVGGLVQAGKDLNKPKVAFHTCSKAKQSIRLGWSLRVIDRGSQHAV